MTPPRFVLVMDACPGLPDCERVRPAPAPGGQDAYGNRYLAHIGRHTGALVVSTSGAAGKLRRLNAARVVDDWMSWAYWPADDGPSDVLPDSVLAATQGLRTADELRESSGLPPLT